MPKLAANLTMMFNEVEFIERFIAAADAGFEGVEFLFPYGHDKNELSDKINDLDLELVLHNLPAGDWDSGERGIAALPGREGEFQDSVGQAIEYACALGCKQLNCLSGIAPSSSDSDKMMSTLLQNLHFASTALADNGIKLLIEPINTIDMPGIFLNTTTQALEIIAAVASDNLWLQYDIYHMQIMEGDITRSIEKHLDVISHMQLADNPGRHEPGTGEINYPFLFNSIDAMGYEGWIGCEYKPATGTIEGLGWTSDYLNS